MDGGVFVLAMIVICAGGALACLIVALRAGYELEKHRGNGSFWKASTSRPNMLRAAFSANEHEDLEAHATVKRLRKYLLYAAVFFALMVMTVLMNPLPAAG